VAKRTAAHALGSLERIARRYGPGLVARKLALLAVLADARLESAHQLRRLHELLCFLDAYPDDRRIRGRVRRMLREFGRRPELRRHRNALASTGIAGTDTPYRFFWPTAHWIAQHWPGALVFDRDDEEAIHEILAALPPLLEPAQAEWLIGQHPKDLAPFDRLVPHGMTDADFMIGLIAAMPGDDFSREAFGDRLDLSYVLRAGPDTPERTTARFDRTDVHFQTADLQGGYPDLRAEARRGPRRILALRGRDALAAIRLARVSMITRERDVAALQFANPGDVFLVDDGRGLAFAMMGMIPERRATLPATYTALTLKNGVPIGYIQVEVLGRHGALSFNTFETFRGAEAAQVLARFLAAAYHLFSCTAFSVEPYQLGAGNEEGIASGAWWFYQRLGFRPRALQARRIAAREVARRAANDRYRSPPRTLRALARWHMFYSLDPVRKAKLPRSNHWLEAATDMTRRYGQQHLDARRNAAVRDALNRLGRTKSPRLPAAQRAMLARWAPLILALTAKGRWSSGDRQRLLRLILAKSGRSERDFLRQLLRHAHLKALLGC
jgi:muconolactone delta-isomerase